MKKIILAALLMVGSVVDLSAGEAYALPDCTRYWTPYGENGYECTYDSGWQFRGYVRCNGEFFYRYAPWRSSGRSGVWCPTGAAAVGVQFRRV